MRKASVRYYIENGHLFCENRNLDETYEVNCTVEEFLEDIDYEIETGWLE